MKILITGGAGFIGSWLVDLLIEKRNEVIVIDNLSTGSRNNLNKKAKFYCEDIVNAKNIEKIFFDEKPEIVIHAAANAMLRKSLEDPIFDANSNIIGTISVLESCRKTGVKKIIYTSTGGARVGEPEYLPVDENHPLNPSSPYGISKHSAEHYIWMYHKIYGLNYLIFCFGNVYGPRDSAKTKRLIPLFIEMILRGEKPKIFGDGEQTRDFVYVKDLSKFIVDSINKEHAHKLFHLANGKQISVNEIFEILKKVSGRNVEAENVDAIKGEVRDIVLNIKLAQKELGWEPTTEIEKGIRETWNWFKNRK